MRFFVCFIVVAFAISMALAADQTIDVRGVLECDGERAFNVTVILRESDTIDPDDTLASTTSNGDGFFNVKGSEDEIGDIEPYLWIIHQCAIEGQGKCRRTRYEISEDHINGMFDMGFVNLNSHTENDVIVDC